ARRLVDPELAAARAALAREAHFTVRQPVEANVAAGVDTRARRERGRQTNGEADQPKKAGFSHEQRVRQARPLLQLQTLRIPPPGRAAEGPDQPMERRTRR